METDYKQQVLDLLHKLHATGPDGQEIANDCADALKQFIEVNCPKEYVADELARVAGRIA